MLWTLLDGISFRPFLISFIGLAGYVSSLCPDGSRLSTVNCLRTYFNDTGQAISRDLGAIINSDADRRRRRAVWYPEQNGRHRYRRDGGQRYETTRGELNPEWCGAFRKQLDCYDDVRRSCSRGPLLVCQVLGSFAQYYGLVICDRTISDWVVTDPQQSCKDVFVTSEAASASDVRSGLVFALVTMVFITMIKQKSS